MRRSSGPCMCGDTECRSCGVAQGTIEIVDSELPHCGYCDGFHLEPECEAKRETELAWRCVQWCQLTPGQRVPEDTLAALRLLIQRARAREYQAQDANTLLEYWLSDELLFIGRST